MARRGGETRQNFSRPPRRENESTNSPVCAAIPEEQQLTTHSLTKIARSTMQICLVTFALAVLCLSGVQLLEDVGNRTLTAGKQQIQCTGQFKWLSTV